MRFFPKKTVLMIGLLATVTTIGVYNATAGGSAMVQRPTAVRADSGTAAVEMKVNKPIRVVGDPFFPDNADIKLLGAAAERAKRG